MVAIAKGFGVDGEIARNPGLNAVMISFSV